MATQTADSKHKYQTIYPGQNVSLDNLVNVCHKALSTASGWKYYPLKPGAFGYDNMVHSIATVFDNYEPGLDVEEVADLVHQGWITNYTYWRDNQPFKTNSLYLKPGNALGDERRNNCAKTPYNELPEDEKEKDRIVAKALIALIVV